MSAENFAITSSLVIFIIVMYFYSKEKIDNSAIITVLAILSCFITAAVYGATLGNFIDTIEFEALIFIISMQIIINFGEKNNIFQWIAVKVIHYTKGDHVKFFFLICILASFSSIFVADITVIMVFIPLVIRACKILKINPSPFLFGLSLTINVGSVYSPFSSSENVLISASFGLDFAWFLKHLFITFIPFVILTLIILKRKFLNKIDPPEEIRKQILLEIMSPDLVLANKKKFKTNSYALLGIIICLMFISESYLVVLLGAIFMAGLNKAIFAEKLRDADWKILILLISTFLILGTMEMNGTFVILGDLVNEMLVENILVSSIIVLLLIGLFSGFLAQVPTALLFINLLQKIYGSEIPDIIIIAFILGINIGSNFLPQGGFSALIALNIAKKNNVDEEYNFKSLLKEGSIMTVIHLVFSIIYLIIYATIFS